MKAYDTYVGITKGFDPGTICVGILKHLQKEIKTAVFKIIPSHFDDYFILNEEGRYILDYSQDLIEMADYLVEQLRGEQSVRFLIEGS